LRLFGTAVTLSAAAAGFLYLYFVDPLSSSFSPPCLFTVLFGAHCPGCGSLRALHALAHGELKAALGFNALLVIALPVAAFRSRVPFRRHQNVHR
jgi:hypothetical protein